MAANATISSYKNVVIAYRDNVDTQLQKEEDDDDEVEEMVDDEPMHISGRLFIGSIDAARNVTALKRLRISEILALIGKGEERGIVESSYCSFSGKKDMDQQFTRTMIEIQDSKDGDLLRRLPGILATLDKIIVKAERDKKNVLVHCIAGRSRSAAVIAAWMLASASIHQSAEDVVDQIRIVRPWIEINTHFMQDLDLFSAVLGSTDGSKLSAEEAALLTTRSFPRLDFDANLVAKILQGTKTITMRLLSDIKDDDKSDLEGIFPHSVVTATSSTDRLVSPTPFAYLRIDQIEIQELHAISQATLVQSGFSSSDEVLSVLQQFYPNVTTTTSLLILHFYMLSSKRM